MKYINRKTGNVIETNDIIKSELYELVNDKQTKKPKKQQKKKGGNNE